MSDSDRLEIIPILPGSGIEPEEAPARHVQSTQLSVNLSGEELPDVVEKSGRPALAFKNPTPVGTMRAPVTSEMPAGEAAALWRRRCGHCTHFRQEIAKATLTIWDRAPEKSSRKIGFEQMVTNYARTTCGDRIPTEHDRAIARSELLNHWGICAALTEERNDTIYCRPDACCPDGIDYFIPRDRVAQKASSAAFDAIMRRAQGKS